MSRPNLPSSPWSSSILLVSISAPLLTPYDYAELTLADQFQPPSMEYPPGTNRVGRDILSRTLYSGRVALAVGFPAVSLSILIGVLCGYYLGWVEVTYGLIFSHILPLVIAPLLAAVTFSVNAAILLEAGLSFLGVGIPLPTPSWGNMLETARSLDVLQDGPWMWMPPAFMILLTVLSINFIGDGLRDAVDPKHTM